MPLSWNEIKERAVQFSQEWGRGSRELCSRSVSEKAESQTFWNEFFNVFGVQRRTVASFEEKVRNIKGQFGFIDLFWRGKLLAEHKSAGKDLSKAASQAFEYIQCLKDEKRDDEIPQYVIVSDFRTIILYDLEAEDTKTSVLTFSLNEFHKHVHAFAFIPGYKVHKLKKEDPANIRAAELMGRIHDALADNMYSGHALEQFLVRILFCLFSEDTGIFEPNAFTTYIEQSTQEDGSDLGPKLGKLFEVLDTPEDKRQKNIDTLLASLRYVNGGLFEETLRTPDCNRTIRNAILVATRFDWSRISPAIFGSLFQSVMNPDSRRKCGAHYTTEENILKVINPLFLDELRLEFQKTKNNRHKLNEFHLKISKLTFFDPACGCGNFLVLAYREMRLLEMDVLAAIHRKDTFDLGLFFHVDVDQFYGIEILEFPVRIAETALWLMDHQMNLLASERFGKYFIRLPLQKTATIIHGNALRIDWDEVLPKQKCSYILGNPPFVGGKFQEVEQKKDAQIVLGKLTKSGLLDYVACWYLKAAEYIIGTKIHVGFVSTNSITQGEQVGILWGELFKQKIKIQFAYPTFEWTSEARGKAHVHCVIIGFSPEETAKKRLYEEVDGKHICREVRNISPYLLDGSDVAINNRTTPICDAPEMRFGNQPIDGGFLLLNKKERTKLLHDCPEAKPYLRKYVGSEEFINGIDRYCLWLIGVDAATIRSIPAFKERVENVRKFRLSSKRPATQELAQTAAVFAFVSHPESKYLLIPAVSSEHREYVPIGFMSQKDIASNACLIIPNATLYHFGVLTSRMHNAWMRRVCGRLESRYRYSAKIVYNNFPWPVNISKKQRTQVEEKANAVLDARKRYPESTLADLYAAGFMPKELVIAHRELDRAVEKTYRKEPFNSERERACFLFALYEKLTQKPELLLPKEIVARKRRGTLSSIQV